MAASRETPPKWRGYGPSGAPATLPSSAIAPMSNAPTVRPNGSATPSTSSAVSVPQTGEETSLAERRAVMMQAEKVADDLRATHEAVTGPNSPVPPLATAVRRLERRAAQAPALIEPAVKAIDTALTALEEARAQLEHALRVADFDPAELERIEERLFALRAAGRKYNVPVDELAALAGRYDGDLALIDAGAERLATLEREAQEASARYRAAAQALSAARRGAAQKLDKAVNAELKPLKLERAQFSTQIESESEGPNGLDRVEFWVRTNPGTRPGPLMKVASGGELARFLLALKVVLADRGSAPTLVFDEIDTGVGGAVADAIGVRLARLASGVQVIAVTHAPQVAARADRHYLITKDALAKGKRVATRVAELQGERRREEIARMLAGAEITAEARAAAERLIRAAGRPDPEKQSPVFGKDHAQAILIIMARREKSETPVDVLTEKQAKAEHARLGAEIAEHDRRYYQEDAPTVSDADYDALRQRYNAIEARFPQLRTLESLTQRVGAAPSARFAKVRHAVPMLSLDNAFAEEDVVDFVGRIRRFLRLAEDEEIAFSRRAEDRRSVDVAALRGWRAGHRRDARRRRRGRRRHRQCENAGGCSEAAQGQRSAGRVRSARRNLHDQGCVPRTQSQAS